jgi:SAM-dependent methyltransferase
MTPQELETQKYTKVYRENPDYKMGGGRMKAAQDNLLSVPIYERTSYLDVGCGRGEMLEFAADSGYKRIAGVESVSALCNRDVVRADAWFMPFVDKSYTVVSCFDVIEHILPEDELRTLEELKRLTIFHLFITANNLPSNSLGFELHVNRKPYEEWDSTFRSVFEGWNVNWLPKQLGMISETWQISRQG